MPAGESLAQVHDWPPPSLLHRQHSRPVGNRELPTTFKYPTALINFANGLRADYDAVFAALELSWSNGRTEGFVNRLKCLKRQTYGRAKLDLLRQRLMAA